MPPSPRRREPPPPLATTTSNTKVNAPQQQSLEMSPLQQRLLWPPRKSGDSNDEEQIDIVHATRLGNTPCSLPLTCGVCLIDNGIRFDPDQFPDIARKTQEKLATKIIESGTSPELGKTIKVKEYSSKSRKRIRFACSREECNVTFQINFDSKKGHWFMKRNKGNFQHSCSAVKSLVEQGAFKGVKPSIEASVHEVTEAMKESAEDEALHLPESELTRSESQSLKRCSPEPSPDDEDDDLDRKKSRTQSGKRSQSHHQSRSSQSIRTSIGSPVPYETSDASKTATPKIRNGSGRAKRVRTVKQLGSSVAERKTGQTRRTRSSSAVSNRKKSSPTPAKQVQPSPSSVTISVSSQEGLQRDKHAPHVPSAYANDTFTATVSVSMRTTDCRTRTMLTGTFGPF